MFVYEKDGKLNMILGKEGKRQFPAGTKVPEEFKDELVIPETPDVVVEKINGKTSISCNDFKVVQSAEDNSSTDPKDDAFEEPATQSAKSRKVKG